MKYLFYPLLLIILLASCKSNKEKAPSTKRAFYYWKTATDEFNWNDSLYNSLGVNKLYVRFFDVDWNDEIKTTVPVSSLQLYDYRMWGKEEIVPVVFITNETFKHLNPKQSVDLAKQVHKKIMAKLTHLLQKNFSYDIYKNDWWEQNPYDKKSEHFDELKKRDSIFQAEINKIKEIQFDCDWTKSTRANYFTFLEQAKKLFSQKNITSTIRLYQYKYPKEAGIPPVNRGMLMCYNAGDIRTITTDNSIFNKKEILSYLKSADEYPVPLDYALPIFEWAVLYRDGKFKNLLSPELFKSDFKYSIDSSKKNESRFIIQKDFVYGNTQQSMLIRKGDEIRFEQPSPKELKDIAEWISDNKNNKEALVSFYHLDENAIKKYSKEIETIFRTF